MGETNLKPIEYQLLADDKRGNMFEIPAASVKWKTERTGRAGSLEFTFAGGDKFSDKFFSLNCGDIVRLEVNGEIIFWGYVFSVENSDGESFTAAAYDQMRYLMYSDTYVFTGRTATEIIRQIAADFGVKCGEIEDTRYVIPKLAQDNRKLLDIISEALSETVFNTGKTYALYDKAGALTLKSLGSLRLNIALGDYGMVSGYTYGESIDRETYNRVKLIKDNGKEGSRDVYIYQDGASIAEWGLLQYYRSVDNALNAAMIENMGKALLSLKNRAEKSFKLRAMGDVSCRAGASVFIELSDVGVRQFYVIESAEHSFEGNDYVMDLTLKAVNDGAL
ncbi:MAG: hypothetical protein Q8878_10130 [Bacillota bacterium]|nr:hypothetical protein [Bacillota bacterium]